MKDSEIIDLYLNRNESAISATAEKYGAYCRTVANNILQNAEDAEECVNDTYLRAWNSIPPSMPERLSTFLGKITRNLSINMYNRYNTEKRGRGQYHVALSELENCIPHHDGVEAACELSELESSINRFLGAQTEEKRNIFIRRYWYMYSIRDIAKVYGMTESRVASILFRMRNELRAHFEKEDITL